MTYLCDFNLCEDIHSAETQEKNDIKVKTINTKTCMTTSMREQEVVLCENNQN